MKPAARLLLPLFLLSLSAVAWAHGGAHELVRASVEIYRGVTVLVNGNDAGEQGFIYDDRTYLPVRAIAESLGASIEYDEAEKTVRVQAGQQQSANDPVALVVMGNKLAEIREATTKYMDIAQAKEDGFKQASGMVPNHGYHFMNTLNVLSSINLQRPAGLVYIHDERGQWQLAAVEYTAILKPSEPLLPGGQWVKHDAACHYDDGNELLESNPFACPSRHPHTGSKYTTWHPSAWTFHVWAFYPNPYGLYAAENPMLVPYNLPGVEVEHHH